MWTILLRALKDYKPTRWINKSRTGRMVEERLERKDAGAERSCHWRSRRKLPRKFRQLEFAGALRFTRPSTCDRIEAPETEKFHGRTRGAYVTPWKSRAASTCASRLNQATCNHEFPPLLPYHPAFSPARFLLRLMDFNESQDVGGRMGGEGRIDRTTPRLN